MKEATNIPKGRELCRKFVVLEAYHMRKRSFCNLQNTDSFVHHTEEMESQYQGFIAA